MHNRSLNCFSYYLLIKRTREPNRWVRCSRVIEIIVVLILLNIYDCEYKMNRCFFMCANVMSKYYSSGDGDRQTRDIDYVR